MDTMENPFHREARAASPATPTRRSTTKTTMLSTGGVGSLRISLLPNPEKDRYGSDSGYQRSEARKNRARD